MVDKLYAQLLSEYSNTVDASVILAIVSDYDLANPTEMEAARQTLDMLKESALTQQESGFDPSGGSGPNAITFELESLREENESAKEWQSQTDDTSLSQDVPMTPTEFERPASSTDTSAIRSLERQDILHQGPLDEMNGEAKEKMLLGIFPSLKPFDIQWSLKKNKGDVAEALDDLMTQSFLEDSGTRPRGIEAFSGLEFTPPLKKGKGKGKAKGRRGRAIKTDGHVSPEEGFDYMSLRNKWDIAQQNIDFIASRTGMPKDQVRTIYHQHGASMGPTIAAIIEAYSSLGIESDDPMVQIQAFEIRQQYPKLSISDAQILVQITYPSVTQAEELAKALASQPNTQQSGITVELQHAPVNLDPEPRRQNKGLNATITQTRPGCESSASDASMHREARDMNFEKASAAYRRGKSDHLMGAVAAYYGQEGRDHDAKYKGAVSAGADAMVASQSSKTQLDLHGVSVKDALRISRERLTTWYHEIDEHGVHNGYRIVTGVGNHSTGRVGKLGPAVGKMLLREGWKVQVGHGILTVLGVDRNR